MSSPSGGDISREIVDRARALAQALNRHPAVERLRQAHRAVQEREAARIMLRDLRARQQALLRREAAGEAVSDQEWEEFRRVAEVVAYNPYVRDLLQAEEAVAGLLATVMAIVEEGLGLPRAEGAEEEPARERTPAERAAGPGAPAAGAAAPPPSERSDPSRLSVARSRLWVPGQPLPRQP